MNARPQAEPYDPAASWQEPDGRYLNAGVRAAPSLPLAAFGPLAEYVSDLAASKGGSPAYLATALLTAVAGVVGDARAVRLRAGWIEPCALWGLLVGPPSAGKSQPLDLMKMAVRGVEPDDDPDFASTHRKWRTAVAEAEEMEAQWKTAVKLAVKDRAPSPNMPAGAVAPPQPMRPRILVGNVTPEKLSQMFAAYRRGLYLVVDEGAAWFGNFGKYGGDGDASFYLSAFNGISTTIDRIREGGSVSPDRALLSACVGIQPERLCELLFKRPDDGFLSRFLPVWPDPIPPVWATPVVDELRVATLFRRLRSLRPVLDAEARPSAVVLPLAPNAEQLFSEWWLDTQNAAQDAHGFMAGFLGKSAGVTARLALVLELLKWSAGDGPEPLTVTVASVAAAIALYDGFFAPMAERVYGDASRPAGERAAAALLSAIKKRGARTVNKRDVCRAWRLSGLTRPREVQAALDMLTEGDWLRPSGDSGPMGGRPASDYLVNPRLWDGAP